MRAITYSHFGGPEVLQLTQRPVPHAGPDVLLVETKAVGLNPVDWKARQGYLEKIIDTEFPVTPGWDIAGVVIKVGLDTPEFAVGDEIFAYARKDVLRDGTLAEKVAVPVRTAALKPATLSFEKAAAVPLAGLTALQSVRRAGVTKADTVLIHGGSGGVGGFGVQLAALTGARVVATASAANHEYVASLGATPVTYGDGLAPRALAIEPKGFDVVLDFAGGASLNSTAELLRPGGRVISIADRRAATDFGGHAMWVRPDAAGLAELADLIDEGKLRVEVAAVFDFAATAQAYRLLEEGHVRGKVVVRF